jgi:outer membrane protein OmpA-like peptidoglycan-associated protein
LDGNEVNAIIIGRGNQEHYKHKEGKIMKKVSPVVFGVVFVVVLMGSFAFAQQDKKGCKDHPLFTRMPGTYISDCKSSEFDARKWADPDTQGKTEVQVEGKYYLIQYYNQKEFVDKRSDLQVSRNYQNAMKKIGGSVYARWDEGPNTMKLLKDGKEIWAYVSSYRGDQIRVEIIEKEAMKQEVIADAKFMADGISSTGHVAIYGIYFDFNKSDVKPESEPALNEISKLLTGTPNLKVFIVGHTDNVGGVDYNMKLSQARADAVVKALTTKYKVNPQSLKAYGVGQLAPVAPNKTEDGRAKNRRVELVEQ